MSWAQEPYTLDRTNIEVDITEVFPYDKSPEEILKRLSKALSKAKKNGFTKIKLDTKEDPGDENSLPTSSIVLTGWRQENEEEWHKRLEHVKSGYKRDLDNAQRVMDKKDFFTGRISEIDAVLEKSSLRCVECGKPTTCQVVKAYESKLKRLCPKCSMKD